MNPGSAGVPGGETSRRDRQRFSDGLFCLFRIRIGLIDRRLPEEFIP